MYPHQSLYVVKTTYPFAEAQEYKHTLFEQCAVSEEARNTCISDYKKEMSFERYACNCYYNALNYMLLMHVI
jgi:hypothetical protein